MKFRTLIRRNLRYHARAHLGVVLGAAVGSAALIGALVVGDSVRGSLRDIALQRLGEIHYAMAPSDRFFRAEPRYFGSPKIGQAGMGEPAEAIPALRLPATISSDNGSARANQVQLIGIPDTIWKLGGASQLTNL